MSDRGRYEDASTLLLLVPFIASGAYALYLWTSAGFTLLLPTSVYLGVTRDPYVFLAGTFAVLLGLMLDLGGADRAVRRERLASDSGFLQKMAAACFVLSLIMALYANGFLGVLGAATDFVVGRYSVIFPALLVLLSYLINPNLKLSGAASPKVLGFLAMLSVPVLVLEVGKRNAVVGLSTAAVMMAVGFYLLVREGRTPSKAE